MTRRLEDLVEAARSTAARARREVPEAELRRRAEERPSPSGRLVAALRPGDGDDEAPAAEGHRMAIIAEVKRASPLEGTLRHDLRPLELARTYAENGAAAISVLTEERFFGGSLDDLEAISREVPSPTLRKDFVVEPYQVYEAAVRGAASVLLIVDILDGSALDELVEVAHGVGLDALVEFHHGRDLEAAVESGSGLVGVNNRDLETMEVDAEHCLELVDELPSDVVAVAESGVSRADQVRRLRAAGYDALLVGTALVRAADPGAVLRRLRAAAEPGEVDADDPDGGP